MRTPSFVVVAALALGACDGRTHFLLQSATTPSAANVLVRVPATSLDPQVIVLQPLVGFVCPVLPAFDTTFRLVIAEPAADMFLNEVRLRLVGGAGIGGETIVIPRPDLNRRFGSTLILSGTQRAFDFDPRFDCFTALPTTFIVDLFLVDRSGAIHPLTLTASVKRN